MSSATDWIQAISTSLATLVAGFGLRYVGLQLKQAVEANKRSADANEHAAEANKRSAEANEQAAEANKISGLMAVLSLESALSEARFQLSTSAARRSAAAGDASLTAEQLRSINEFHEERIEQYLNSADRICACIRRGYVDEEQYRKDYRSWIAEIISHHKARFGPDTRHQNVLHVHNRWSQDQSARSG